MQGVFEDWKLRFWGLVPQTPCAEEASGLSWALAQALGAIPPSMPGFLLGNCNLLGFNYWSQRTTTSFPSRDFTIPPRAPRAAGLGWAELLWAQAGGWEQDQALLPSDRAPRRKFLSYPHPPVRLESAQGPGGRGRRGWVA